MLLALLLPGCWWEGPALYGSDSAIPQPIQPGLYEIVDAEGERTRGRISETSDGALRFDNDAKGSAPSTVRLVPLRVAGRRLWISQLSSTDEGKPAAIFGLVEQRSEQFDLEIMLDCEGSEDIVRAAGGKVVGNTKNIATGTLANPTCRFADRGSLERALTAYALRHPVLTAGRARRIGD